MRKSIYFGIAFFLLFLTVQSFMFEKVALRWKIADSDAAQPNAASAVEKPLEVPVPDWLKWSLLTPGLLFLVYAYKA